MILVLLGSQQALADQTKVPYLCNNILQILSPETAERIAREDIQRRNQEVMLLLGPQRLQEIHEALGLPPFQRVQSLTEALAILERVANDPSVYQPINEILSQLTGPRRWALYLLTGFHAVSTHSDGHRSMIQQSVNALPKAALLGGNAPRLVDYGIGNANLMVAGMANNPKAIFTGVDVAGGSLNRSMQALNEIADELQTAHQGPQAFDYGRFSLIRGSGSDPELLRGQKFDGASWVLTLFSLPKAEREQALRLSADLLEPGGTLVLVDPTPAVYGSAGKVFLKNLVTSAYQNNPDLNVLDVALLTAMNTHGLFKTEFMTGQEQRDLGIRAGLVPKGPSTPIYLGVANHQEFEKPWKTKPRGRGDLQNPSEMAPSQDNAVGRLTQIISDQAKRLSPEPLSIALADNSQRTEVANFVAQQRESLGVQIPIALDQDFADLEAAFQAKGGFLFTLRSPSGELVGTFAFSPLDTETAEIKKMYLAKPFRRLGLGEKILGSLINYLGEKGYTRVYAETSPLLQSESLFIRAGFSRSEEPTGGVRVPLTNTFWLQKQLPQ